MMIRVCALFLMAWGWVLPSWNASESNTGISSQEIQANEVRIYLQPDFAGPFKSWQLVPGMRQLLVEEMGNPWEGHIASLRLGSDVGVMLFQNKHFRFYGSGYINFNTSISDLKTLIPVNTPNYSSLIIYPFPRQNPLGILVGSSSVNEYKFFPLPEQTSEKETVLADIRNHIAPIDFIMFFFGSGPDEEFGLTLYTDMLCRGASLELPDTSMAKNYQLSNYNFAGKPKSLRMQIGNMRESRITQEVDLPKEWDIGGIWKCSDNRTFEIIQARFEIIITVLDSGSNGQGLLDRDQARVILYEPSGQKQMIWTITGRDSEGSPIKIDMGSGLELTRFSSLWDISGRWQSNAGLIYDISQSGTQFKWTVIGSNELGAGELQGKTLKAFWTDGRSTFSGQGEIVTVSAPNKATRIEWDNGVIFYR